MRVKFYFDPSCPFTWITSRWIIKAQQHRDIEIEIDWRPFSLAIKNEELNKVDDDQYANSHRASHRVLRVMLAAYDNYQTSMVDMYNFVGQKYHLDGQDFDDTMIRQLIDSFELPDVLVKQADNIELDVKLEQFINEATSLTGNDVGVPIITFASSDGAEQGFFGPVLQSLPNLDETLKLWDGISSLASSSSFYELKRSRPTGQPDVESTRN